MNPLPELPLHPRIRRSWFARLSGLAWIILCFEIGVFLLVYPWMDGWERNELANWREGTREIWVNPYVRGAVSGIGIVNIGTSLRDLYRYLREVLFD